jgi:hypothetical protein
LPVAGLPGRGLDVNLGLAYNGRIWNKSTNSLSQTVMTYDVDRGWPAPGFRLGYGHLESQTDVSPSQYVLVDPGGTRHKMVNNPPGSVSYESDDGTFIHLTVSSLLGIFTAIASYPDGSQIIYSLMGTVLPD